MRAGSPSSDQLVRFAGLDVTVYSSDGKRSPGHLSRQGSPQLRWAAFEAAKCAARPGSPDYAYYHQVAQPDTARDKPAADPRWPSNASCCAAAITPCASWVMPRGAADLRTPSCLKCPVRVPCPPNQLMLCGPLPNSHCRHPSRGGRPEKTERPHPSTARTPGTPSSSCRRISSADPDKSGRRHARNSSQHTPHTAGGST